MHNFLKPLLAGRVIAKNAVCLTVVEAIRVLMPFVALPYIIKTVGSEKYGIISFSHAVIAYFITFADFGLNIITVKDISENINNKNRISILFTDFIITRTILSCIGLAVIGLMVCFIPLFHEIALVLFFTYISVFAESLTMTSFFQGYEKMENITIVKTISLLFYVATLFIFVKKESDYVLIPLLQSLGLVISSVTGIGIIFLKYKVSFVTPSLFRIKRLLKRSFPFSLSRFSVLLNNNIGKIIAGMVLGMHEVAVLDLAKKINDAAMIPFTMLDQAIYPYNAKNKNKSFARKAFIIITLLGVTGATVLYFIIPILIRILGDGQLNESTPLARFLCIYLILCSMTYYLGPSVLVAFGHAKYFNNSVIISSLATVLLYVSMYYMNLLSLKAFIGIMIVSETIVLLYRGNYCLKYNLLKPAPQDNINN